MVLDVDHHQHDSQAVFPLKLFDAGVYVFWMQAVVLQTEEESTRGDAEDIVGYDVTVLSRDLLDAIEDRVTLLAWRHNDRARSGSIWECLRFWLYDTRFLRCIIWSPVKCGSRSSCLSR